MRNADSRMFPLGAQELGAPVLHQHTPAFTMGTAPFSGYAPASMQTDGLAEHSFQPSGLSQDQLRAIYEGRGEAPRREMPGRSVIEYRPEPVAAKALLLCMYGAVFILSIQADFCLMG